MSIDTRPESMEHITTPDLARSFIDDQILSLRSKIGNEKVVTALSGGVDSFVVAVLLKKSIGENLTCIHVDHGLLRKGESEQITKIFYDTMGSNLIHINAADSFLNKLEGVADPEEKRKIIGTEFSHIFEEEARKIKGVKFLGQGTIYPDVLESHGVKTHHNVGGLSKDLSLELVEPIRFLFKDEVRVVGKELGLPDSIIYRQPFPGPGLGIRCTGAITRDRLEAVRESDAILREEFTANDLHNKVWQYFTIIPDYRSTGVRNSRRTWDWPVIIRAINTKDAMSAEVEEIPWDILKHITRRILDEVPGVNRVLYDLSPKPCATIEWE